MTAASFDWSAWKRPAPDFSLFPFWFWNDRLDERELVRQIDAFQAHGIDAFVIHPRIGLPRDLGWLSDGLFRFMRLALEEARRRGMRVILYDEGMYPSGSAGGLVVARDPSFQTRALVCSEVRDGLEPPPIEPGDTPVPVARFKRPGGREYVVRDQKVAACIRGLHYLDETDPRAPKEEAPDAADILNPQAVQCFIELVHERFYAEFGEYFGDTILAIFTDEPLPLPGLRKRTEIQPGNHPLLAWVNDYLGYDFTPHLPALWHDDAPDAARHRAAYHEAIAARLNETYYGPIAAWCEAHGVALTGHPDQPDDIGNLRHLQIPGQDVVWRHILPDTPSALEGAPSTQAKAASSVKFHQRRARNLNEFGGAYGEMLTFDELRWVSSWLLVRGCDLLVPHAFYYSLRGPRKFERPPDVGLNSPWWDHGFKEWALQTRRLCWLNATFSPVCHIAILGNPSRLPWGAAKTLFENQIDFHYVEPADLENATMLDGRLVIGPGRYSHLIVEDGFDYSALPPDAPVLRWPTAPDAATIAGLPRAVTVDGSAPALRARHLAKDGVHVFQLFNEATPPLECRLALPVQGRARLLDPATGEDAPWDADRPVHLPSHGWNILLLETS